MIFVDTSGWLVLYNKSDHRRRGHFLSLLKKGKYGEIWTSDYNLKEIFHVCFARGEGSLGIEIFRGGGAKSEEDALKKARNIAFNLDRYIQRSGNINFHKVTGSEYTDAKQYLKNHRDEDIDFVDWLNLAIMERNNIRKILIYDNEFENFLKEKRPEMRIIN